MIRALYEPMLELETFRQIRGKMQKNTGVIQVGGCIDSQKAHLIACLAEEYPVTCIIAPDDLRAREIYENYRVFDRDVLLYPARDYIFFQADLQSRTQMTHRVRCMKALADITSGRAGERVTVIVTISALMGHCMKTEDWMDAVRSFCVGDEIDLSEERAALSAIGYERTDQVEEPGQFASRGGIFDIYPLTEDSPVRIELWGDEIYNIRTFDPESQRARDQIEQICIYPASEFVTSEELTSEGLKKIGKEAGKAEILFRNKQRSEEAYRVSQILSDARDRLEDFGDTTVMEGLCDYFYPEVVSFLDYFPKGTAFFLDEPQRARESADAVEEEFRDSMTHRLEKGYIPVLTEKRLGKLIPLLEGGKRLGENRHNVLRLVEGRD